MFPTSQWAGMLGTICIDDDLSSGRGVVEEASTLGGIDGGACRAQSAAAEKQHVAAAAGLRLRGRSRSLCRRWPPPLLRVVREVMRHGACWASAPSSSCCESQNKKKEAQRRCRSAAAHQGTEGASQAAGGRASLTYAPSVPL
jgi:hypothetical protein